MEADLAGWEWGGGGDNVVGAEEASPDDVRERSHKKQKKINLSL